MIDDLIEPDTMKSVEVDTDFDETMNVMIDLTKVNFEEKTKHEKLATPFYGILPRPAEKIKLPIKNDFYYTYLKKRKQWTELLVYAPAFNEYFRNIYGIPESKVNQTLIRERKMGYNVYTNQTTYSDINDVVAIDSEIDITNPTDLGYTNNDNILSWAETSIALPPTLSKPHIYNMFKHVIDQNSIAFKSVNRFLHRCFIPTFITQAYNASKRLMYSEVLSRISNVNLTKTYANTYITPWSNNRMELDISKAYKDFVASETLEKKYKIMRKLPMKTINQLTRNVPNVNFIKENTIYDTKRGIYLLDLNKFLAESDLKSLGVSTLDFPVLCRHEYLQFVEPDYMQLNSECYVKGKCRYCGNEIYSDTVINRFEVPPCCYYAIQYYAKLLSRFYINAQDFQNCFNGLAGKFFTAATRNEYFRNYSDSRIYAYIIYAMLEFIIKETTHKISKRHMTKMEAHMSDVVHYADLPSSANNEFYKLLNAKTMLTEFVEDNCTNGRRKGGYAHTLFEQLFKKKYNEEEVARGIGTNLSQDLYFKGEEYMHQFHTLMFFVDRKLWSRKLYRQIATKIKAFEKDAWFKQCDMTFIDERDIMKLAFTARGLCPINYYHEFVNGVCKHCKYKKGTSYKRQHDEITEFAKKWISTYHAMPTPEIVTEKYLIPIELEIKNIDDLRSKSKEAKCKTFENHIRTDLYIEFLTEEDDEATYKLYEEAFRSEFLISQMKRIIHQVISAVSLEELNKVSNNEIINFIYYLISTGNITYSDIIRLVQKHINISNKKYHEDMEGIIALLI